MSGVIFMLVEKYSVYISSLKDVFHLLETEDQTSAITISNEENKPTDRIIRPSGTIRIWFAVIYHNLVKTTEVFVHKCILSDIEIEMITTASPDCLFAIGTHDVILYVLSTK